jgi:hypothetical protein
MKKSARYFLDRAALCRRLANAIPNRANPIIGALRELADQFDEQATCVSPREKQLRRNSKSAAGKQPVTN